VDSVTVSGLYQNISGYHMSCPVLGQINFFFFRHKNFYPGCLPKFVEMSGFFTVCYFLKLLHVLVVFKVKEKYFLVFFFKKEMSDHISYKNMRVKKEQLHMISAV
jgi:hypothetical protein